MPVVCTYFCLATRNARPNSRTSSLNIVSIKILRNMVLIRRQPFAAGRDRGDRAAAGWTQHRLRERLVGRRRGNEPAIQAVERHHDRQPGGVGEQRHIGHRPDRLICPALSRAVPGELHHQRAAVDCVRDGGPGGRRVRNLGGTEINALRGQVGGQVARDDIIAHVPEVASRIGLIVRDEDRLPLPRLRAAGLVVAYDLADDGVGLGQGVRPGCAPPPRPAGHRR